MRFEKIAFAKIGWAERYDGDTVAGKSAYLDETGDGQECFNFKPYRKRYYGITVGSRLPALEEDERSGWLVVFIAPREGTGPLTVVGWYEDATFHPDWQDRPEYKDGHPLTLNKKRERYKYTLSAERGFLIPSDKRHVEVNGEHFSRAPVVYARRPGDKWNDPWRKTLAKIAEDVVASWSRRDLRHRADKVEAKGTGGAGGYADKELREKVDRAAIRSATRHLEKEGYTVEDVQRENCGYDLLARRNGHKRSELHVEVKGTSEGQMHFYMTRNEHETMNDDSQWRLLMVTKALTKRPDVKLLKAEEVRRRFTFKVLQYEASERGA